MTAPVTPDRAVLAAKIAVEPAGAAARGICAATRKGTSPGTGPRRCRPIAVIDRRREAKTDTKPGYGNKRDRPWHGAGTGADRQRRHRERPTPLSPTRSIGTACRLRTVRPGGDRLLSRGRCGWRESATSVLRRRVSGVPLAAGPRRGASVVGRRLVARAGSCPASPPDSACGRSRGGSA